MARADARMRERKLRREHLGDLRRARFIGVMGLLIWPLFLAYDYVQAQVIGSGDFGSLMLYRVGPMPLMLWGVYELHRRPTLDEGEFHFWAQLVMCAFSLSLALLCIETGGFASWYVAGNLLCASGVIMAPRHFCRALQSVALTVSVHPLVMASATIFDAPLRAQLDDPIIRATIAQHVFVAVIVGLAIAGMSHTYWRVRRELFRAHDIGRYALNRLLGKGGMSEVWAAHHRQMKREVALKILEPELEGDEVGQRRFEREIEATASLCHPHTIRLFDFGVTEEGLLYYAMERLEGENLHRFVRRRGPLPVARALHLASAAAHALGEAHALGIVHRDVKAENLFVARLGGEPDYIKVLDFGIASVFREPGDVALTAKNQVAGTPTTISPEVVMGEEATPASDVYAMGVVLYFMLTGRLPFEGDGSTMLVAHVHEPPRRPQSRVTHAIPEEMEALVMRCLAKSPLERPPNGSALAMELDRLASHHPWEPRVDAPRADSALQWCEPAESDEGSSASREATRRLGSPRSLASGVLR